MRSKRRFAYPPQRIVISRARLAALVPLWLTCSFVLDGSVDATVRAFIAAIAIISLVSPVEGLLLVAVVAPLGDLVMILFAVSPVRFTEAVAVAFLAGWLLREPADRRHGPAPGAAIKYAAWAFAAVLLASLFVQIAAMRAAFPGAWAGLFRDLWRHYYWLTQDPLGGVAAFRWIEGLALVAAVVTLFRRAPVLAIRLPQALAVSCVVAGVSALLLWNGFALPAVLERGAQIGYRVRASAHVSDINAAGSYFSLMLCLSVGMAARERGAKLAGWAAVAFTALAGLWLGRSRSAEAAAIVAAAPAVWWLLARRFAPLVRSTSLAVLLAVLAVGVLAGGRLLDPTSQGVLFRRYFTETSYRMIHAYPWFGLGIGQYYALSSLFLPPQLAWSYGSENAHNYFLQTAAEIGLLGLASCLAALGGIVSITVRAIGGAPHDYRLLGLATGVAAFLFTCTTGHPFLVFETAYPFWLSLGLVVALASPIRQPERPRPLRRQTLVLIAASLALLAVSIPIRARQGLPGTRSGRDVDGLYEWERGSDGRRYRWTEQYASLFVDASARRVEIPVRLPRGAAAATTDVKLWIEPDVVYSVKVGPEWTSAVLELPPQGSTDRFRRINLKGDHVTTVYDRAHGAREVGVQIGTPRTVD